MIFRLRRNGDSVLADATKGVGLTNLPVEFHMQSASHIPSGDIVITPGTGHFRISPVGFFGRAEEFHDASVLLSEKTGRFSFVAAFLSCRSIELALKAYLLARGDSLNQVKNLGHDLHETMIESYARGIDVVVDLTAAERDLILAINDDYMDHNYAYFDLYSALSAPKNPDLHLLPTVARKLLDGVKQGCLDAGDGDWTPLASDSFT